MIKSSLPVSISNYLNVSCISIKFSQNVELLLRCKSPINGIPGKLHFCLLCVLDYFVAPLFFKSWSLAVLKKGISVDPPPPPQLHWVKAVISLLTLGFVATSSFLSFSFCCPSRDVLKPLAGHGKGT